MQNKPSETNFWKKGDDNDLAAKTAYEALLTISLLMPRSPTWSNFSLHVKERAYRDYNFSFPEDEEVGFIFTNDEEIVLTWTHSQLIGTVRIIS